MDGKPRLTIGPVAAILLLALLLRALAAWWWQARLPEGVLFGLPDSVSYWHLAQQIVAGQPYVYGSWHVFRVPGYPILLALVQAMVAEGWAVLAARLMGALLGTAAVGVVMLITWQLFDRGAAYLSGLWAACYPGAIGMSVFVLSEAPFCPLMLCHIGLWIVAWQSQTEARLRAASVGGGLAAGAAVLMRPSWILFLPFAALLGMACRDRGRQLRIVGWMLLAMVVVLSPWWLRNYRETGRLVLTTLQVGASLYDGLRPGATGASDADMQFVNEIAQRLREEEARVAELLPGTFEYRLDRRLRQEALHWASGNPGEAFRLALVKLGRMWSILPHAAEFQNPWMRVAVAAGYLPTVVFGVFGAFWFARRGWPYLLCFLPVVYFSGIHAVFVGSIRYRQPALLVLIVLAAGAAFALASRIRSPSP